MMSASICSVDSTPVRNIPPPKPKRMYKSLSLSETDISKRIERFEMICRSQEAKQQSPISRVQSERPYSYTPSSLFSIANSDVIDLAEEVIDLFSGDYKTVGGHNKGRNVFERN